MQHTVKLLSFAQPKVGASGKAGPFKFQANNGLTYDTFDKGLAARLITTVGSDRNIVLDVNEVTRGSFTNYQVTAMAVGPGSLNPSPAPVTSMGSIPDMAAEIPFGETTRPTLPTTVTEPSAPTATVINLTTKDQQIFRSAALKAAVNYYAGAPDVNEAGVIATADTFLAYIIDDQHPVKS